MAHHIITDKMSQNGSTTLHLVCHHQKGRFK